ncbi:MAG: hypothetical protein EBU23_18245, partial [Mycobacteriaceae bacterium]|nr:hypothetical protein [Mycobacteriaceae bacterium]
MGTGFGALALAGLLKDELVPNAGAAGLLEPKQAHYAGTASRVCHIYQSGGQAHQDTWDPKPGLAAAAEQQSGSRKLLASPFKYTPQGKSGLENAAADLIMETDAAVGRVLAAVAAAGAEQDTLVIFTSDNGFAPYAGAKELEARGHFPSGPLRDYKTSVHEGGHREPFIVRWPGKVAAGATNGQLVHQADVLATLAEILGTPLPADAGEDSFSFLPLLKGVDAPTRPHAISCAAAGTPGLRVGSWKYIATEPAQLYDLAADLGETKNLAAQEPARLAEMKALLEKLITEGRSTPGAAQKNDVKVVRLNLRNELVEVAESLSLKRQRMLGSTLQ